MLMLCKNSLKVLLILKRNIYATTRQGKHGSKRHMAKCNLWELVRVTVILKSHRAKKVCSTLCRQQIRGWWQGRSNAFFRQRQCIKMVALGQAELLHSGQMHFQCQQTRHKPRWLFLNKLWHHCVSWHMPVFLVVVEHGMKVSYMGIDNMEQGNWKTRNRKWAGKRQCCSTCWKVEHENCRDGCPSALAN